MKEIDKVSNGLLGLDEYTILQLIEIITEREFCNGDAKIKNLIGIGNQCYLLMKTSLFKNFRGRILKRKKDSVELLFKIPCTSRHVTRRARRELGQICDKEYDMYWSSISGKANDDTSLFPLMEIVLRGPPGSPYEGGRFHLMVEYPKDYPFKIFKYYFAHPVFHPYIEKGFSGWHSCPKAFVDRDQWSPILMVKDLLLSMYNMLKEYEEFSKRPEFVDHYRNHGAEAYELLIKDPAKYIEKAREITKKYAM